MSSMHWNGKDKPPYSPHLSTCDIHVEGKAHPRTGHKCPEEE